jgi:PAS domain-containing protein
VILERGIRAPRTAMLRASYDGPNGVDALMQRYLALGKALLQTADQGGDFRPIASQLISMSQGEFLDALDKLVDQYQQESEASTDTLRLLQWCALLAALGLLAFSALGVLRPLIAQVRRSLDEQESSERALRAAELQQQHFQRRLVDAIEALDDAFALFDADDRLTLYNLRFTEAFPLPGETIAIGMSFSEFVRAIAEQRMYAIPNRADGRAGSANAWQSIAGPKDRAKSRFRKDAGSGRPNGAPGKAAPWSSGQMSATSSRR